MAMKPARKPVSAGDYFTSNELMWKVVKPYKVKGHWIASCESKTRVFSGGTIVLFRVRAPGS